MDGSCRCLFCCRETGEGTGTEGSCCAGEVLGRLLTPVVVAGLNAFTMSFSGSGFLVFALELSECRGGRC